MERLSDRLARTGLSVALAFGLLARGVSGAPVPTPAPGTGLPLAQPTPTNPVQYVVGPGQVGSSSAQNSNFFKVYSDLAAVTNALNGCSYIPGAALGSIAVLSPLNVSIAACSNGTGTGTTATISLTGVVPQANLPPQPTFSNVTSSGLIYANGGITSTGQTGLYGNPAVLVNYNGGGASGLGVYNGATGFGPLAAGTGTFSGPLSANGGNVAPVFTNGGGAIGGGAHIVIGVCAFAGGFACSVPLSAGAVFSSGVTYSCAADYGTGTATAANDALSIDTKTATSFRIVNAGTSGGTAYTGTVVVHCIGY